MSLFAVGILVSVINPEYQFEGEIVSSFLTKSKQQLYVVEDKFGALHILSTNKLIPIKES